MKGKSRLRRLLGLKAKAVVSEDRDTASETDSDIRDQPGEYAETEVSSTSSGRASSNDSLDQGSEEDPYADVRDRLEELSARDRSRYADHSDYHKHEEIQIRAFAAYTTYLGYAVLILCGHIRDLFAKIFGHGRYVRRETPYNSDNLQRFAPLLKSWENFYTRRLYHRIQDCFNRPIASNPGATIQVLERVSADGSKSLDMLGTLDDLDNDEQREVYTKSPYFVEVSEDRVARTCLNLGSYNYLGFADDWNITCEEDVVGSMDDLPVSNSSARSSKNQSAAYVRAA